MLATVKIEKEINIKTILIAIQPRYIGDGEDDDMPTDTPLLKGQLWAAKVDIDTGVIHEWPQGKECEFSVKVCDMGNYSLFDDMDELIASKDGYVPNGIVPGEYGDYVDLKIDGTGKITNWPTNPDVSEFFSEDD